MEATMPPEIHQLGRNSPVMATASVFWDNSNIWLVGRNVCSQREPGDETAFRIHFRNLLDLCLNGRSVDYAIVGGSLPPQNDDLWLQFKSLNIDVDTQERGELSGREVAVDQMIQFAMANRILDAKFPGTMILLTGDGAGYNDGKGFIKALERATSHGWRYRSCQLGCRLQFSFAQFCSE
jgi:hypothetical protein